MFIANLNLNDEKGKDMSSQEADLTGQLHNNEQVYDTNVKMTQQETRVGDSERPFSSQGTAWLTE